MTTTTLPRYKTLLDKFTPSISSSLPPNEQQSTTVTTTASIVSNSNTLIRNYYENLCNNSSATNSITSSTSANNRKKRSISNEYDFSSTNSMINDGRSLPKRFRPIQSSTGNDNRTRKNINKSKLIYFFLQYLLVNYKSKNVHQMMMIMIHLVFLLVEYYRHHLLLLMT